MSSAASRVGPSSSERLGSSRIVASASSSAKDASTPSSVASAASSGLIGDSGSVRASPASLCVRVARFEQHANPPRALLAERAGGEVPISGRPKRTLIDPPRGSACVPRSRGRACDARPTQRLERPSGGGRLTRARRDPVLLGASHCWRARVVRPCNTHSEKKKRRTRQPPTPSIEAGVRFVRSRRLGQARVADAFDRERLSMNLNLHRLDRRDFR